MASTIPEDPQYDRQRCTTKWPLTQTGKETSKVCIHYSSSSGGCLSNWFLPLQSQSTYVTQHTLDTRGMLRIKESWELAAHLENLQYCKQTPEGGRDYEILKRESAVQGRCVHQKRFKRPPESLARLIGKGLSLYRAST